MGKREKKTRRDTAEIARSVVEQAIGESLSGAPFECDGSKAADSPKRPGGIKGGRSRANKLTAKRRSEIAKKAARAFLYYMCRFCRWFFCQDDGRTKA